MQFHVSKVLHTLSDYLYKDHRVWDYNILNVMSLSDISACLSVFCYILWPIIIFSLNTFVHDYMLYVSNSSGSVPIFQAMVFQLIFLFLNYNLGYNRFPVVVFLMCHHYSRKFPRCKGRSGGELGGHGGAWGQKMKNAVSSRWWACCVLRSGSQVICIWQTSTIDLRARMSLIWVYFGTVF